MPIVSWRISGGGGAAQSAPIDATGAEQLKRVPVSGGLRCTPEEGWFWDGGIGQGGRPFVFGWRAFRTGKGGAAPDRWSGRRPPGDQDQPLVDEVPAGAHLRRDRQLPR